MYRYYVSYAHTEGFGAVEYGDPKPITSFEQVNEMAEKIRRKQGYSTRVIILNYILLRKDD